MSDELNQPLVYLTLGGIDGEEYDDNDIEIASSKRLQALQRALVKCSEPVTLELFARPVADAGEAVATSFEQWAKRQYGDGPEIKQNASGRYLYAHVQKDWELWQVASRAAPSARMLSDADIVKCFRLSGVDMPADSGLAERMKQAVRVAVRSASSAPAEAPSVRQDVCAEMRVLCSACRGTRRVYTGPIGDPPEECEACFDQSPDEAPSVRDLALEKAAAICESLFEYPNQEASIDGNLREAARRIRAKKGGNHG